MKRNLLTIFLIVVETLHVVGQTPTKVSTKNDKIEQEVRKAIKDFDDASERGDVAKLEALITEDYFHTDVKGKVQDRADWVENTLKPYAGKLKSGQIKWEAYNSDEIRVRVYGDDIAAATGRITLKSQRDTRARVGRFTQLLVRREGSWQRAVYQLTWITQEENK
jgi:ketosteroid isomerase-like protein